MNLSFSVIVVLIGITSAPIAQAACTNAIYDLALSLCSYSTQIMQHLTFMLPEYFNGPLNSTTTEALSNYCSSVTANNGGCSDDLLDNCLAVNQQIFSIRFAKALPNICQLNVTLQNYKTLFDCENQTHWFYYFQQYQAEVINNVTAQHLPSNANLDAILKEAECRIIQLYKEQIPETFIKQQCGEDAERTFLSVRNALYEAFRCGQPTVPKTTTPILTMPTGGWYEPNGAEKPFIHTASAFAMLFVVFFSQVEYC